MKINASSFRHSVIRPKNPTDLHGVGATLHGYEHTVNQSGLRPDMWAQRLYSRPAAVRRCLPSETLKSAGHICFTAGGQEFYELGGEVYRANLDSVMDVQTGARIGRWECSRAQFDRFREMLAPSAPAVGPVTFWHPALPEVDHPDPLAPLGYEPQGYFLGGVFRRVVHVGLLLLSLLLPVTAWAETVRGEARVVDGDTLEVAGERVRLHGIDAPEGAQGCLSRQGMVYRCGDSAERFLVALVGKGAVSCRRVDTDRYGRMVAVCEAGGKDLGRELVRAGWALAYRRYSEAYVREEGEAQARGLGLWSGTFVAPWEWRKGVR